MKVKVRLRARLQAGRVKRAVKLGAVDALTRVGAVVQEKTRREMSNRSPLKIPRKWRVGEQDGRDLVAYVNQVPKADRVTSWKTRRSPRGMLLQDIRAELDRAKPSAVVGPAKIPALNKLHEFGGQTTVYFTPGGQQPRRKSRKFQRPIFGFLSNQRTPKAIFSFRRSVKARSFMEKGMVKSRSRIPEQFRNRMVRSS